MDEQKFIREYMSLMGCDERQARATLIHIASQLERKRAQAESVEPKPESAPEPSAGSILGKPFSMCLL